MKMRKCPFCGKEISVEAVLCKHCHNLLIDDDGNVIVPEGAQIESEPVHEELSEDKTRVFTAAEREELNRFEQESKAAVQTSPILYDDVEEEYEDDYEDYEDEDEDDSDVKKKVFVTAAAITIGILVIVIVAIFVGVKLFGYNGKKDNNSGTDSSSRIVAIHDDESDADVSQGEENNDSQSGDVSDENGDVSDNQGDVSSEEENNSSEAESQADDTSSEAEESSVAEPVEESSSQAEVEESSSQADESVDDTSSETPAYNGDDSAIVDSIKAQIGGNITSYEFRTDDGYNLYYYFFTDNGQHGYSVAYNKSTGNTVIDQNY